MRYRSDQRDAEPSFSLSETRSGVCLCRARRDAARVLVFGSVFGLLVGLTTLSGCSILRPPAQRGVDLLENGNRSPVSRTFAGVGAVVGLAVMAPITIILSPSYLFEDEGD